MLTAQVSSDPSADVWRVLTQMPPLLMTMSNLSVSAADLARGLPGSTQGRLVQHHRRDHRTAASARSGTLMHHLMLRGLPGPAPPREPAGRRPRAWRGVLDARISSAGRPWAMARAAASPRECGLTPVRGTGCSGCLLISVI